MRKKLIILVSIISLLLTCINPISAFAYSKSGAITYADNWATNMHNPNYPDFSSDCANFVSQILHEGGGLAEVPSGGTYPWNIYFNWGWQYSTSWTVANDLKNWLINTNKGYVTATWDWNSNITNPEPINNSANLDGDEAIFYDWDSDGTINHASYCIGYGMDIDTEGYGTYGDLIDQYTTDRKHVICHLKPYNSRWSTTTIVGIQLNNVT